LSFRRLAQGIAPESFRVGSPDQRAISCALEKSGSSCSRLRRVKLLLPNDLRLKRYNGHAVDAVSPLVLRLKCFSLLVACLTVISFGCARAKHSIHAGSAGSGLDNTVHVNYLDLSRSRRDEPAITLSYSSRVLAYRAP